MKIAVVIPTRNAGDNIAVLLNRLEEQTRKPDRIMVVDSDSEDATCVAIKKWGNVDLRRIPKESFDHGGTRHEAVCACPEDIILFLTQDALPADEHYIENILKPFTDERIAAVCGRQLPKADATDAEREVRTFRYPAEGIVWSAADIPRLGMRAYTISDVCAAYRRSAYMETGGFDRPVPSNEDMLMAEKLLRAGYKLCYAPEAAVLHSHRFTPAQEFRRNYAIGRVLRRYAHRLGENGDTKEGLKMVMYVLKRLLVRGKFFSCVGFCVNCAARLLGNRAGKRAEEREQKKPCAANR